MQIILLRHGPAVDAETYSGPDEDRPLTPTGRVKTRLACRGVASLLHAVDRLVTSPAARTLETAQILQREFAGLGRTGSAAAQLAPRPWPELWSGDLPALTHRLREAGDGSIVCVGHEPTLSSLASQLLTGSPEGLTLQLKKCGALAIEMNWSANRATLLWHLTPAQFRQIGDSAFKTR